MMEITKIRGADSARVADAMRQALDKRGYTANISTPTSTSVRIQNVRLGDKIVSKHGYNISPYTARRGRILSWNDWVDVNNTTNKILDIMKVSANAKSLGGKFRIREGTRAYTEDDWEDLKYDNVGSMVNPIERGEAWKSEGIPREKKKLRSMS